ncbi:glycoside hydrolase family 104 protein [Janthinobacterium sp.]|uniref:glycoside hydrolase family 24 protein n=1 Tax=Janthinobacterium sp. TaxID=1871054 RepID=UPI00293D275B|nr:glycoside hydrolase family 104 protein [Janthinobacterium sp.]
MRVVIIGAGALICCAAYYAWTQNQGGESDQSPDLTDYVAQAADAADGYMNGEGDTMNQAAFLRAIRVGEGADDEGGYNRKCGGGQFDGYSVHPALAGWHGWPMPDALCDSAGVKRGSVSTAAGAYQINLPTWTRVSEKLGLNDFSPASQDAAALQLISEKGAAADVAAGRTASAVYKIRKIWASLPGAGYGQRQVSQAAFDNSYQNAGGVIA